jgi:hypothetical protein
MSNGQTNFCKDTGPVFCTLTYNIAKHYFSENSNHN